MVMNTHELTRKVEQVKCSTMCISAVVHVCCTVYNAELTTCFEQMSPKKAKPCVELRGRNGEYFIHWKALRVHVKLCEETVRP